MNIMNYMMFPATTHLPPPIITPPQNHPSPPENHQPQNHLQFQHHHPPTDLAIFLANYAQNQQKIAENQVMHQQQLVSLISSLVSTPSNHQQLNSSVHKHTAIVSANSVEFMQNFGTSTVHTAEAGEQQFQATPHLSLTPLRSPVACINSQPPHNPVQGSSGTHSADFAENQQNMHCTAVHSVAAGVEQNIAENTTNYASMLEAPVHPFSQALDTISRFDKACSGVPDAQGSISHVETPFFKQKSPLSGAFFGNNSLQACTQSSTSHSSPILGVSMGENHQTHLFAENGSFQTTFPQNFQQNTVLSQPQIPGFGNVKSGFQAPLNHHVSPTIFTQQIASLPNCQTFRKVGLTAQCTDAVTVQSVSAASTFSVPAVTQGSMPDFPCANILPITSLGSRLVLACTNTQPSCTHTSTQPFVPTISACAFVPTNSVTTQTEPPSSSQDSTFISGCPVSSTSPPSSSPFPSTKSFASLLKNSSNLTPTILAPIPSPCIKGNLPAIKLDESVYQKAVLACKFNLIGRLILPKGSPPLKVLDLHSKLNARWSIKHSFKLTPIGRGFFCLRFKNHDDQNQAWLQGHLNLHPGTFRLQPWHNDFNPEHQTHTTSLIWVRLHGITQEYWDPQLLISIASLVGIPQAIDPNTKEFVFGHYARIRVEVNLLHTLHHKLLIEREGYSFEVLVTYENPPKFCMHCHFIGHLVGECRILRKVQVESVKAKDVAFKQQHFHKQTKSSEATTSKSAPVRNHKQPLKEKNNIATAPPSSHPSTTVVLPVTTIPSTPVANTQHDKATTEALIEVFGSQSPTNYHVQSHHSNDSKSKSNFKSVETVVPCSFSAPSDALIPKNTTFGNSTARGKPHIALPCTSNLKRHYKNRHHNRFEPLNDHLWDDDGDGENWISDSNASETDPITDNEHHSNQLNVDQALNWGNMAEDDTIQSWEAMADANYEAIIAKNQAHNEECCIQLHQNDNSSILNQNFPPLGEGSPVNSFSASHTMNASSSGSEYVPSPLKTRAQRQKEGTSVLPLHKQKKLSKAAKREANALLRLSKPSTNTHRQDPDEYQWNLLLADQKTRAEASVAAITSLDQPLENRDIVPTTTDANEKHQPWKVCVYARNHKHKDHTTDAAVQQ